MAKLSVVGAPGPLPRMLHASHLTPALVTTLGSHGLALCEFTTHTCILMSLAQVCLC